jgi:hypothetical protein
LIPFAKHLLPFAKQVQAVNVNVNVNDNVNDNDNVNKKYLENW